MAFVKIDKSLRGTAFEQGEPAVRMGTHRSESGKTIYFTITRTLVENLGWDIKSTEKRDTIRVAIHEGVGEDAGFWLIEEDLVNGYMLGGETGKRQAFTSNLMHSKFKHYLLNDDQVPVHDVEFVIQDKAILVQVPDWLRYNPQSYKEPPKLELTPPPAQPIPRKEDKKPSRPTIRLAQVNGEGDKQEIPLNREQRRKITASVTRALR